MASLLLGCGALLSEKIRKRHRLKKENEREYAERFEEMKAENIRRENQRQLHRASQNDDVRPAPSGMYDASHPDGMTGGYAADRPQVDRPPSYELATGRKGSAGEEVQHQSRKEDARGRPGSSGNERTRVPLIEQTQTQRSTELSPSQRIATRDMALENR